MKTCISSYSFAIDIDRGVDTQFSVIQRASDLGVDAIEFTDLTPPEGVNEAEYARKLAEEAKRCNIEIACYSVCADFINNDLDEEVKRLCEKVDIAELLGAKLMRHDVGSVFKIPREYRGFTNLLPRFADGCRKVTEYAATKGIRTMTENHGFFCQDSARVESLVNTVANPNYGLLVDVGNFICADEDSVLAVGRVAPYAFHVHIKDFLKKSGNEDNPGEGFFCTRAGYYVRGTVAGHGVIPLRQCVEILKQIGYNGYLTLEFEGPEELDYALRAGVAKLKKLAE